MGAGGKRGAIGIHWIIRYVANCLARARRWHMASRYSYVIRRRIAQESANNPTNNNTAITFQKVGIRLNSPLMIAGGGWSETCQIIGLVQPSSTVDNTCGYAIHCKQGTKTFMQTGLQTTVCKRFAKICTHICKLRVKDLHKGLHKGLHKVSERFA